jgi:hypothetical protein
MDSLKNRRHVMKDARTQRSGDFHGLRSPQSSAQA